jgi:cell division protein ZapE
MDMLSDYRARLAEHLLQPDEAQADVARRLAKLADALNAAPPQKAGAKRHFWQKPKDLPHGIYIHGDVGRGKTMLMDMFYRHVTSWPKDRIHFHAFMQQIHIERASLPGDDVIGQIADRIAARCKLLCLDEMQIVDITDAMIIGRLYEAMLTRGVVLVTTSNRHPDDLYHQGLNRDLFLPFIETLKAHMDVISLDAKKDYRLGRVRARESFLHPATAENRVAFNTLWKDLTDGAMGHSETLDVLGRKRIVPKVAHACASFTFFELCGEALGPPDYLAIAKAYRTIFISGVTKLKAHQRNETKRFILMVDTFYDAGTRLVILADAPPEALFPKNQHSFESQRAISRLKEMQSAHWWGQVIVDT